MQALPTGMSSRLDELVSCRVDTLILVGPQFNP